MFFLILLTEFAFKKRLDPEKITADPQPWSDTVSERNPYPKYVKNVIYLFFF